MRGEIPNEPWNQKPANQFVVGILQERFVEQTRELVVHVGGKVVFVELRPDCPLWIEVTVPRGSIEKAFHKVLQSWLSSACPIS